MKRTFLAVAAATALLPLAACQSEKKPGPGAIALSSENTALSTMERVALAANSCWFKSKDAAFRPYRLAPELNSFTGRPRILVVPARNPGDRPLLVVQAEGHPAKVEAFGPLMQGSHGNRIASDIRRWSAGDNGCAGVG
ncbi:hypothetical protein DUT91_09040 [Phyllobacterium salinisoli]|uniref:Lipoprotein n=1 Tax=Phyllobacterium salinisoli TaxID=1899321 RepID=A0A368K4U6_9HYPH|nr:hypothetical protein [Phyllobacterium salinisoli]RCS24409.1 hypothetical protein DUT91_09040 [Phyllobacterium salinisoli]